MGPGSLDKALCGLQQKKDENLIAGFDRAEDAGVYRLTNDIALVQTLDFFTPIADDPYVFGQIAAANALSDVYAMGGRPLVAMNIVCFPSRKLNLEVLREILKGGLNKLDESGTVLVGGHSIDDPELKYGLSVTGIIHPDRIIANNTVQTGDRIILTKPIGTGIINTALKRGFAGPETVNPVIESMLALNRKAAEIMVRTGVNACTDVTGFGLLGHACEMIPDGKGIGMVIYSADVPVFPETENLARLGLVPGGAHRNRKFRSHMIENRAGLEDWFLDILFDPQTSGGLLISVSPEKAESLLNDLRKAGIKESAIIGEVVADPEGKIVIK